MRRGERQELDAELAREARSRNDSRELSQMASDELARMELELEIEIEDVLASPIALDIDEPAPPSRISLDDMLLRMMQEDEAARTRQQELAARDRESKQRMAELVRANAPARGPERGVRARGSTARVMSEATFVPPRDEPKVQVMPEYAKLYEDDIATAPVQRISIHDLPTAPVDRIDLEPQFAEGTVLDAQPLDDDTVEDLPTDRDLAALETNPESSEAAEARTRYRNLAKATMKRFGLVCP